MAAAAAAIPSLAGAGTGIAGTLSTVFTVFSAASSIFGGLAGDAAGKAEAAQIELQAQADRTEAAQEEARRQKRLRVILAQQNARFGASGGTGLSQARIQLADVGEANKQRGEAALLTSINDKQSAIQASQSRSAGKSKLIGGFAKAGSILATEFLGD